MPYSIRQSNSKYKVVNKETGKVKGTHTTKAKAQKQINLLRGVEHGWHPTGAKARAKKK